MKKINQLNTRISCLGGVDPAGPSLLIAVWEI